MFRSNREVQSKSNKSKREFGDNQSESKSSSNSSYITSDYTTLQSTDGYTLSEPSTSSTSKNSNQTPSVFPKWQKNRESRS